MHRRCSSAQFSLKPWPGRANSLYMSILLLALGFVLLFVGGIMMLIAAFHTSIGWFLAYLFLPFGSLVFLIVHWAEAKVSFLLQVAGLLLIVPYALTSDAWKLALSEGMKTYHSHMSQTGSMGATDEPGSDNQIGRAHV